MQDLKYNRMIRVWVIVINNRPSPWLVCALLFCKTYPLEKIRFALNLLQTGMTILNHDYFLFFRNWFPRSPKQWKYWAREGTRPQRRECQRFEFSRQGVSHLPSSHFPDKNHKNNFCFYEKTFQWQCNGDYFPVFFASAGRCAYSNCGLKRSHLK